MSLLFAMLLASFPAPGEPHPEIPLLLVHDSYGSEGFTDAVAAIAEALGSPDAPRRARDRLEAPLDPAHVGAHPGLQAYRLARHLGAGEVWLVQYDEATGWIRLRALDLTSGVTGFGMVKVRSVAGAELEDDQRDKIVTVTRTAQDQLARRRRALKKAPLPFPGTLTWTRDEDPVCLGFDWEFRGNDTFVTHVWAASAAAEAGLAVGDEIRGLNDNAIEAPAWFGRWAGPLKGGDKAHWQVQRGGESLTVKARAEWSSDLVPRHAGSVIGKSFDELEGHALARAVAVEGAGTGTDAARASPSPIRVLVVLRAVQEDTLDLLPVLSLHRDQHPGELELLGIGSRMDAAQVEAMKADVLPRFEVIADPDGKLTRALCVTDLPDLLLLDRKGVIRFRPGDPVELRRAVDTLLAEGR